MGYISHIMACMDLDVIFCWYLWIGCIQVWQIYTYLTLLISFRSC